MATLRPEPDRVRLPEPRQWIGVGLYSTAEAARLAGLASGRVSRWVAGYRYKTKKGSYRDRRAVFARDLPRVQGRLALTFYDLVEVAFVRMFIDHGVPMSAVRRAAETASEYFGQHHPFCIESFRTDGRAVFASMAGDGGTTRLIDLGRRQTVFDEVFSPLLKQLEYTVDGDLERWWPMGRDAPIAIDPERAFGTPVIARAGVPTHALAAQARSKSARQVADLYELAVDEVEAAIDYEKSLVA